MNRPIIKTASICYSGGGIHLTWGSLANGNYFYGTLEEGISEFDELPTSNDPNVDWTDLMNDDWMCHEVGCIAPYDKADVNANQFVADIILKVLADGSAECDNYNAESLKNMLKYIEVPFDYSVLTEKAMKALDESCTYIKYADGTYGFSDGHYGIIRYDSLGELVEDMEHCYDEWIKDEPEDNTISVVPTKNYKSCKIACIGESDIASLVFRGCGHTSEIKFGADGSYRAYVADEQTIIPSHYQLIDEYRNWLWIYDDECLTWRFKADTIKVYRAGDFGCIIQQIGGTK